MIHIYNNDDINIYNNGNDDVAYHMKELILLLLVSSFTIHTKTSIYCKICIIIIIITITMHIHILCIIFITMIIVIGNELLCYVTSNNGFYHFININNIKNCLHFLSNIFMDVIYTL